MGKERREDEEDGTFFQVARNFELNAYRATTHYDQKSRD